MKIRSYLNSTARAVGNKIQPGLGDYLTRDINLEGIKSRAKSGLVKKVGGPLVAVGLTVGLSGCLADNINPDIAASVGWSIADKVATDRIIKEMDKGRGENSYDSRTSQQDNKRRLIVLYYKDFNGNGKVDKGELLGDVKDSINLDRYGLYIKFETPSNDPIIFFILNSNEEKVTQTISNRDHYWYTSPGVYSGDWIDKFNGISKENPGKYTLFVRQEGSTNIFRKTIEVLRDGNP